MKLMTSCRASRASRSYRSASNTGSTTVGSVGTRLVSGSRLGSYCSCQNQESCMVLSPPPTQSRPESRRFVAALPTAEAGRGPGGGSHGARAVLGGEKVELEVFVGEPTGERAVLGHL